MGEYWTAFKEYGTELAYNATFGVGNKLWDVGLTGAGALSNRDSGTREKTVKFALSVMKLTDFDVVSPSAKKDFEVTKDGYYALGSPTLLKLFYEHPTWKKGGDVVSWTVEFCAKGLLAIGGICETGSFVKKYVTELPFFTELSNKMGAFEVYGGKPFTHKPLSILADNPKGFFVLLSSSMTVCLSIYKFALPQGKSDEEKKANRMKELSTDNLLKQVTHIGKILLITLGDTPFGKSRYFAWIDFAQSSAAWISTITKKTD